MTMTNVTGEGGRVLGGARSGPPPKRKQQQLRPSYVNVPPTSPRAHVVSVTSSMTLTEWRIVSKLDDEADDNNIPTPARRQPGPVGPPPPAEIGDNAAGDDPLKGNRRMDVLVSPVLVEDGASMLVAMRIARDDDDDVDGSATRAYVTKIGLAGRHTSWTRCGLIGTWARLS